MIPGSLAMMASQAWQISAQESQDTNGTGNASYTLVNVITAATMLYSGSKFRLTLVPPTTGNNTVIGAMYAGHAAAAGDVYDFDGTQVPVTVGGSSSFTLTAGGADVVTDEISYSVDETKSFIVAFQCPATPASDVRYKATAATGWSYYYRLLLDAATTDKTGYSLSSASNVAVSKIEVSA